MKKTILAALTFLGIYSTGMAETSTRPETNQAPDTTTTPTPSDPAGVLGDPKKGTGSSSQATTDTTPPAEKAGGRVHKGKKVRNGSNP